MKKEDTSEKTVGCCGGKDVLKRHHGSNGAIYGLGVIGALFYFLKGATSLGAVLIGIGKSIVWPAFLVYQLLVYLKV
jgi:hypothetical protein